MILSFSPCKVFELCRPIATKFCTVIGSVLDFIIPVQNFGGRFPKKFRGQKCAKFGVISDDFKLWSRIFLEWIKYSELDNYTIYRNSFGVRRKNLDCNVESYPPKSTFSGDHISASRGCCTPNFYTYRRVCWPTLSQQYTFSTLTLISTLFCGIYVYTYTIK